MAFNPTRDLERYQPSSPPLIAGSEKLYLDRELRQLSLVLERMVDAITEIQTYLKTLP